MPRSLLIAGIVLAGSLAGPRWAAAWVSVGGGIAYAGPYGWAYAVPCPPGAPVPYVVAPGFYPPAVVPQPPVYAVPPVFWPSWGPDVAVRWNRYFVPDGPRVRGYTLPR